MIAYPKVDTLYKRDPETHKVIVGEYSRPEFLAVRDAWIVTEKVDGTNIQMHFERDDHGVTLATIGGRTSKSQIPVTLYEHLRLVEHSIFDGVLEIMDAYSINSYTMFGEGYGPGIQKGGNYRHDQAFTLFDVLINNNTWLDFGDMVRAAELLGIEHVPYLVKTHTISDIVANVRRGVDSVTAWDASGQIFGAEGVVCQPLFPLFDGRGRRLNFKLKTKDFATNPKRDDGFDTTRGMVEEFTNLLGVPV